MENSMKSLSTKERIIQATSEMIAEEGIQGITIRKISARAGVNVAAVNYHFGCKDTVINESLLTMTEKLKSAFQHLNEDSRDDCTNLSMFINEYNEIMFRYPEVVKNVIDHAIHNRLRGGQIEYISFLKTEGIDLIKNTIGRIQPDLDEATHYLKTLQLVSGLCYPFLLGEPVKEIMGVDFKNPETRLKYTRVLLESICPTTSNPPGSGYSRD